jgi:uncharacterized LabA/DUF88 family protein
MANITSQINLDWAARLTKPLRVAARRFLFGPQVNRTIFLIDGFNLYHSVKDASRDLGMHGKNTRWLNIWDMCASYLSAIGNNAEIVGIYYFTAIATHLLQYDPGIEKRHQAYIKCLKDTGIEVELARFKKKQILCPHCKQHITRREEKETDVAIGCKLLEICFQDLCDTVIIVSGDTDIVPAFRAAQRLFPQKQIGFLLPYKRHNNELKSLTPIHLLIGQATYPMYQFPDPFVTSKGRNIAKPASW